MPSEADWGSVWTQKSVELERPPALFALRGLRSLEMALGFWVVPVVPVVAGGGLGFCSGEVLARFDVFAVDDAVDGGVGLVVGGVVLGGVVVGLAHAAGLASMGRTCS